MVGPPGILRGVLDRPRAVVLGCATLCFGLFALLTVAVVTEWPPLYDLDNRSEGHRRGLAAPRAAARRDRLRHDRHDDLHGRAGGAALPQAPAGGLLHRRRD